MSLVLLVFTQLSLKVEPSESESAGTKTDFGIAHDHSKSFILQPITGRQGVAYRHIILLALCLKFPKK